jgi:AcrR family transcriptional regulator
MSDSAELKRSDARRNRDAILAAALEALTDSPDTSLNAISKRAGVANATLYRHFPTREELVLAVYEHEVRELVDAAGTLLRTRPPIDALRSWVERLARYAVTKHGLADALRIATTPGSDLSSTDTYTAIVAALDRLLQANISAGTLRPGLDADDVILALAGLWQLDPASDWRAQARRIYDIVLSGMQPSTPAETGPRSVTSSSPAAK